MYRRVDGDDLLADNERLKYRWKWKRCASGYTPSQLKHWTHFQCSWCYIGKWTLSVSLMPERDNTPPSYHAEIMFISHSICGQNNFSSRLDAQIGAEELLEWWIRKQYQEIITLSARD